MKSKKSKPSPGTSLGALELLVLLALPRLGEDAYGVTVQQEIARTARRRLTFATIYATLSRLESKGLITSSLGEVGPGRGGRRKKFFALSRAGTQALTRSLRALERMTTGTDPGWVSP
jgi:DNA-binding PadR family transcriptional regulator